jgi:hypothetical protein
MPINQFQDPPQPYSLQQITQKILTDCDYALFIHNKVLLARGGDANAKARVDANFEAQPAELDALGIPEQEQPLYARCTDPKTTLIAFAGFFANQTAH